MAQKPGSLWALEAESPSALTATLARLDIARLPMSEASGAALTRPQAVLRVDRPLIR
jgi:hypothetical protein